LLGPRLVEEPERREAGKIRERPVDGVEATCVQFKGPRPGNDACFDRTTGVLLRASRGHMATMWVERLYGDHRPFEGKLYPREIRLLENRRPAIEVNIETLERLDAATAESFAPPEGTVVWPWCEAMSPPEKLSNVEPEYPVSARKRRLSGVVSLYAIVEKDGSVSGAAVVRSADADLDESALQALKRWRFKPASCGGTPVPVEFEVDTSFEIR